MSTAAISADTRTGTDQGGEQVASSVRGNQLDASTECVYLLGCKRCNFADEKIEKAISSLLGETAGVHKMRDRNHRQVSLSGSAAVGILTSAGKIVVNGVELAIQDCSPEWYVFLAGCKKPNAVDWKIERSISQILQGGFVRVHRLRDVDHREVRVSSEEEALTLTSTGEAFVDGARLRLLPWKPIRGSEDWGKARTTTPKTTQQIQQQRLQKFGEKLKDLVADFDVLHFASLDTLCVKCDTAVNDTVGSDSSIYASESSDQDVNSSSASAREHLNAVDPHCARAGTAGSTDVGRIASRTALRTRSVPVAVRAGSAKRSIGWRDADAVFERSWKSPEMQPLCPAQASAQLSNNNAENAIRLAASGVPTAASTSGVATSGVATSGVHTAATSGADASGALTAVVPIVMVGKESEKTWQYRGRFVALYKAHNPRKLSSIADLMSKYKGREHVGYLAVCRSCKVEPEAEISVAQQTSYAPSSTPRSAASSATMVSGVSGALMNAVIATRAEAVARYRARISDIYSLHKQNHSVEDFLQKWQGSEHQGYLAVCRRYELTPEVKITVASVGETTPFATPSSAQRARGKGIGTDISASPPVVLQDVRTHIAAVGGISDAGHANSATI